MPAFRKAHEPNFVIKNKISRSLRKGNGKSATRRKSTLIGTDEARKKEERSPGSRTLVNNRFPSRQRPAQITITMSKSPGKKTLESKQGQCFSTTRASQGFVWQKNNFRFGKAEVEQQRARDHQLMDQGPHGDQAQDESWQEEGRRGAAETWQTQSSADNRCIMDAITADAMGAKHTRHGYRQGGSPLPAVDKEMMLL